MNQPLTKEEIKHALPGTMASAVNDDFVDLVNDVTSDQEVAEIMRGNFMSYVKVLQEGKFRAADYVHAVKYVSYKLMGFTNQEAYARTFTDRYSLLLAKGSSDKTISAYVSIYNKGKLVNLILQQTLIPSWVLNQDIYQQAINTQADLMINARSDLVRTQAANSILTHLKKPEKQEIELNVGVREHSGLNDLRNMLTNLAESQQAAIGAGTTTREIAHQSLMRVEDAEEAEVVDAVEPEA
jgi:hypothetical protein